MTKPKEHLKIKYDYLMGLATHALSEGEVKHESRELWTEPCVDGYKWKACADRAIKGGTPPRQSTTGYIVVSADGGLNQQRIAVCNAVAVARLLNATLVMPHFILSDVWQDHSQFGDIYQEDYFIDYLKNDVTIIKELPAELQSIDLEPIGSLITGSNVSKEEKPSFYVTNILRILLRNRVVHFYGFGHSLAFDPIPFHIQRLRCKCNFHALKFLPKIQDTAALMITRMKEPSSRWGASFHMQDIQSDASSSLIPETTNQRSLLKQRVSQLENAQMKRSPIKYLGLHLRFEIDMVAYSMCDFGGGKSEQRELEAYRKIHFPILAMYQKEGKLPTAAELRRQGRCPLTPEEAFLMLVALGFKRETRIFLAGTHIFGGRSRMMALTSLFPNLVTKEDLLSAKEIGPFLNRSSQLAALDFIVSASADAFAMTDSGSQFAALVAGHRMYHGEGAHPTIRPNRRRLAGMLSKNIHLEWEEFENQVRRMIREAKTVEVRPMNRSLYRHPRCKECMCKVSSIEQCRHV